MCFCKYIMMALRVTCSTFYYWDTFSITNRVQRSHTFNDIAGVTKASESLFTYDEGKNHASYFDVGYVPIFLDDVELVFNNSTLGQQAQDVCGDSKQCLFDIYTTGKVIIGRASKQAVESYILVITQTETTGKQNSFVEEFSERVQAL